MIKVNKIFLQFVRGGGKTAVADDNYVNGQLAPEIKSHTNVILKVIAYKIWYFKKKKLIFEWIVNILHAYNILFVHAFVKPTECLSLTAYYCVCR